MDVDYMCTFGCDLTPPSLQSEVFAWFDFALHRPRLTKIDQFICAEGISVRLEAEGPDVSATTGAVTANGWNLFSNGQICFNLDVPANGRYTFCARLWQDAGGTAPANAEFRVDGNPINNFAVTPSSFATAQVYCVTVNLAPGNHKFAVAFTNDFFLPPIDRNLHVDWMSVDGP